ncbi:MAG: Dolichyl-phosphate-mannose-protein mannosyltransferase [Blastocatellia bacterium]|nr:Dolichyl-phosphate-mannose-protein mannosyltransferase [Blastocatellia bacterium]
MSFPALPVVTAGLRPELFAGAGTHSVSRVLIVTALSVLVLVGFGFRLNGLSSEGLSDDELNKLNAVNEYRAQGHPTGANGEHPFVMKALLTVSVIVSEKWNQTSLVTGRPNLNIPVETSVRVPGALFGSLTAVLIFLVAAELFGPEVGLISAALWAFDPLAIGFNRIAKEDTFLIFFFLLANVFWLRGQRVAESQPQRRPEPFYWATAVAFGAMFASKYVPPVMLGISVSYNYIFQRIPETRWVIGKKRFLKFFFVMGVAFLIFNPIIFLPGSWKAMSNFTSYRNMGHDSYEFLGRLYPHRFQDWLRGEPWYFYLILIFTKMPVLTLLSFVLGVGLLFRRKVGDGRYFLLLWLTLWGLGFMFPGGKFTRYITSVLPAIMIIAGIGIQFTARRLSRFCARVFGISAIKVYARSALASLVIVSALWSAVGAAPHYRLYMSVLGGGPAQAGKYFPQDEFYDAYMQDAMTELAKRARPNARVASEIPAVAAYYAQRANRPDLNCVELSDPAELEKLTPGDFVIDARGRTYFTNQGMLTRLRGAGEPAFSIAVGATPAANVYLLDQDSLDALRGSR